MNKETLQYIDFEPNEEMVELYLSLLEEKSLKYLIFNFEERIKGQIKGATLRGIDAYIKYKKTANPLLKTLALFNENDIYNMIYYIADRIVNLSIQSSMILSEHIILYLVNRLTLGFKISFPNGELFIVNGVLHCKFKEPLTTEEILNDPNWQETDNRW